MTKAWMVSVSALALACTTPGWAHAQSSQGSLLDELIVTAQKREESVQDVPIAVSAFSEQTLKAQGIDG